jgi:hypothetical protein
MVKDKVLSHLKGDIKTFHKEAKEDKELMKTIRDASKAHSPVKKSKKKKSAKGRGKIHTVMHEFKHGGLHSGSKKGPKVKSRKQAVAIALSEARKAGAKIKRRRK